MLKRKHPSLKPPQGPRHMSTAGSPCGVVSFERGTPVVDPGQVADSHGSHRHFKRRRETACKTLLTTCKTLLRSTESCLHNNWQDTATFPQIYGSCITSSALPRPLLPFPPSLPPNLTFHPPTHSQIHIPVTYLNLPPPSPPPSHSHAPLTPPQPPLTLTHPRHLP